MKTENDPKVMKILNEYAGGHRHLITLGRILAAVSAFMGLVPFYDLWKIIRIAVRGEELSKISGVAWQAVGITVAALLVYIAALFCTHIAAFRVQANMRSRLMHRIVTLPLGVFDEDGTGKIRRTVNESTAATETFIAHNLPDKAVMMNADENRFDDVDTQIRCMTDKSDSQVIVKSKQTYLDEFSDLIKMIKLVGGTLSGILALIGILNFVNAVVTGIISRKRELAMMNAVGMTGSQLKKMLMWEGIHYAVLTATGTFIIGFLLDNVILKNITDDLIFYTYRFTFVPILICVTVLLLLSAVIPNIAYRSICRESVVDRLREN